jgi:multidrug efflux pump subunit AcrA (membrane-fusion protein)
LVAAIGYVLVTSVITGAGFAQPGGGPKNARDEATPIVVADVLQRDIAEGRTFVGTVLPSRKAVVGSAVDGRVMEMLVNDGDWVTKDAPLTQLLTTTIGLELTAAKAELDLLQRELAELEISLPLEKAQAEAALARADAQYRYAQSREERASLLVKKDRTMSAEDYEEIRSLRDAAYQSSLEAKAKLDLFVNGGWEQKKLQARAKVAMQEAEVDRLEDQLNKYTIKAPFDGFVTAEHTEVGAWIRQGDPVAEVISIDPAEITVSVSEEFIAALAPGMSVSIRLDAVPGRNFEASITRIVPQADVRSRSFPARISLENPRGAAGQAIKAGMLARVTMAVGRPKPALLVPKDAVILGGPSPQVYVVADDPRTKQATAVPVSVELGVSEGGSIQVVGNLQAGQKVVVQGNERLMPGAKVRMVK